MISYLSSTKEWSSSNKATTDSGSSVGNIATDLSNYKM